jgi:hypothetical protein
MRNGEVLNIIEDEAQESPVSKPRESAGEYLARKLYEMDERLLSIVKDYKKKPILLPPMEFERLKKELGKLNDS